VGMVGMLTHQHSTSGILAAHLS